MIAYVLELLGLDRWLGRPPSAALPHAVALFLSGSSVRQVAAALGAGGPQMIVAQEAVEQQIRGYVAELERENRELRRENAVLLQEIAELR